MEKRMPTLVTYRSAEEMKRAGIRYGAIKAVQTFAILLAFMAVSCGLVLQSELPGWAALGALWGIGVAIVCYKLSGDMVCNGDLSPRLSFEELDAMKSHMGIPSSVFEQTNSAVLHGTKEDHRKMGEQCAACSVAIK